MAFAKEVLKVLEDSEYIAHYVKRKKVIINRLNVEHQNNENVDINHHIETNMIVIPNTNRRKIIASKSHFHLLDLILYQQQNGMTINRSNFRT